jgi:acyl carrier protein
MTDLVTRVSTVIANLVKDEEAFTILDVSEAVKRDGGPFVRHREVQPVARPILDSLLGFLSNVDTTYDFTDITVNTERGVADARLYHPSWYDPDDYTNRNQVASTPSQVGTNFTDIDDEDDDSKDLGVNLMDEDEDDDEDVSFDDDDFNINASSTSDTKDNDPVSDTNAHVNLRFPGAHTVQTVLPRTYDSRIEIPKSALIEAGLLDEEVAITFHPNSIGIKQVNDANFVGDVFTTAKSGWRLGPSQLKRSKLDNQAVVIATFTGKIVIAKANDSSSSSNCDSIKKDCCNGTTDCETAQKVLGIVSERSEYPGTPTLDHKLYDLDLDSLDIAEIILDLEDEFSISLNDADFTDVKTVRDLVHVVQNLV